MNNTQKLWLVGMFKGDRKILETSLLPIVSYFDGLIAVVDDRADSETVAWLKSIKGSGEIIVKKWINDHAHTSNEALFSGKMKYPDYFVIIDETDQLNELFVKQLRENIKYWHQNNVGGVWLDHPFVIRYHDGVRFAHSPHWTISNIIGGIINLSSLNGYRKEAYLFNNRDMYKSGFLSPIKYWFVYPNCSNHTELLYRQFSNEVWSKHENLRIRFRLSCQTELGIECSLDSLREYLVKNVGKYPAWLEEVLETEVNLKDAFRLFVLNQPWQKLVENRFDYSYFKWKAGEVDQLSSSNGGNYIGVFNRYKLAKGEEPE